MVIQKARLEKKMSQADLAKQINERPQVVQEYENGKAVPNQAVLAKMERVLGVKLRGKIGGKSHHKISSNKSIQKIHGSSKPRRIINGGDNRFDLEVLVNSFHSKFSSKSAHLVASIGAIEAKREVAVDPLVLL
ncbi:hypothetical protein K1719_004237 [Acacia pycnantha]|nr:hypothetical protein K1719_004237 [Acacia pycnantha]